MRIGVDVGGGSVALRAIEGLRAKVEDLAPVFRGIGLDVKTEVGLSFRESRDPYGVPWKALAPSTVANRRGSGKGVKPLIDTGVLRDRVDAASGPTSVSIGSSIAYAAIHQFGGTIEYAPRSVAVRLRQVKASRKDGTTYQATRFAKSTHKRAETVWGTNADGWSVTIPARPFVPTSDRGLPVAYAEIIRDRLVAHFRPGARP